MATLMNERVFDQILLEKVQVSLAVRVGRSFAESLTMDKFQDYMADDFVYRLEGFLLGQKVSDKSKTVHFTAPASWFQHLKQDKAPKWYLKRWPVKLKKTSKTVQYEQIECYPNIERSLSPSEKRMRVTMIREVA